MEETKNTSNKALIISLSAVILALAGLLAYLFLSTGGKPDGTIKEEAQEEVTDKTDSTTDAVSTDEPKTDGKTEIDKDLGSLDSLDLSNIENDYVEDILSGL